MSVYDSEHSDGFFHTIAYMCNVQDTDEIKRNNKFNVKLENCTIEVSVKVKRSEKKYQDREWLTEQYIGEERTMQDIANEFGVTPMCICTWLEKFGIETRSRGRPKNE